MKYLLLVRGCLVSLGPSKANFGEFVFPVSRVNRAMRARLLRPGRGEDQGEQQTCYEHSHPYAKSLHLFAQPA
jgi:hypothetical protein